MSADDLDGILAFLRAAERLKTVTRSGWTSTGQPESVAEHTWRLCLMAMVLYGRARRHGPRAAAHDVPDPRSGRGDRRRRARSGPGRPRSPRPPGAGATCWRCDRPAAAALREEIVEPVGRVRGGQSPEARLAKGLDKLETILQHTQGMNPADFDYDFNLGYGRRYTEGDPVLAALRDRLDEATRRRAADARGDR